VVVGLQVCIKTKPLTALANDGNEAKLLKKSQVAVDGIQGDCRNSFANTFIDHDCIWVVSSRSQFSIDLETLMRYLNSLLSTGIEKILYSFFDDNILIAHLWDFFILNI
jgi:hypothetical protein